MDTPALAPTDRFQIIRRLGSGGFGTVYEAFDRKRNAPVALKVLKDAGPSDLYRFKREFRAVADLTHPNLVTLYELISEGDRWCFSMELVDGSDCLSFVREGEGGVLRPTPVRTADDATRTVGLQRLVPSSEDLVSQGYRISGEGPATGARGPSSFSLPRLLAVLRQLGEGLAKLHAEGIVHRDIKPANVLCTRDGRVVLLDFGISQETSGETGPATETIIGTPGYMSPEQTTGKTVTLATDWYAVGTLLYEALTGGLPFSGTALQILSQKTTQDPLAPSELLAGVPPGLDALCMELLQRNPARRPTGEQFLARVQEMEAALGEHTAVVAAPRSRAGSGPFVGRKPQLLELTSAWEERRQGRAVVALVQGESGAGKSTLCKHFLEDLAAGRDQAVALTGRCYEHENVPFKALDGVIDSLSRHLQHGGAREAEALLPRDIRALARLFPALLQAPAVAAAPDRKIVDELQIRQAAFGALRELLLRLSDRHPVVVYIDDLQWGDSDGIALLLEVLRPPDPPPVLLVLAYRSDEEASSPALQALLKGLYGEAGPAVTLRIVRVGPLLPSDAETLVRTLLPSEEQHRVAAIAAEADGNAFFLTELSRSLGRGLVPHEASQEAGTIGQLDSLIRAHVARLPESHRALLVTTAVAGYPILRSVASVASYGAATATDEPQAVSLLRSERLIRVRHARSEGAHKTDLEELMPYHDRVREAVVAGLPPDVLQDCHLRLARALVQAGSDEPERLVFHFQQGGDAAGAARYAIEASARAHQALAFNRSARLCRVALETGKLSADEVKVIETRLADALAATGRSKEAATLYLSLAEREPPALALERRRQAAARFFAGGYVEEGRAALKTLLGAARMRVPKTPIGHMLSMLLHVLLIEARGFNIRLRGPGSSPSAAQVFRMDTCAAVAFAASADPMLAGDFALRGIWYCIRARDTRRLAYAVMPYALIQKILGRSRAAIDRTVALGMKLAEQLGEPTALADAFLQKGHVENLDGHWRASSDCIQRGIELIRGNCNEADTHIDLARQVHAQNLRWRGAFDEMARELPPMVREAVETGQRVTHLVVRANSAFLLPLRDDDPAAAEESLLDVEQRIAGQEFGIQHAFALDARLMVLLYQGRGEQARALFEQRRSALGASGLRRFAFFDLLWRNLTALIALAAGEDPRVAEREARRLAGAKLAFAPPMASTIIGLVQWKRGEQAAATESLHTAEEQFSFCDMLLHANSVRFRRGQWIGGEKGAEISQAARDWMAGQGIRNVERMAGMIVPEVGR